MDHSILIISKEREEKKNANIIKKGREEAIMLIHWMLISFYGREKKKVEKGRTD